MELANIEVPDNNFVYACRTQELPDIFYGLGKAQAEQYVKAMYRNPEFSDGIIKPTQRTTIVILGRFVDYLRYMDDQKFK